MSASSKASLHRLYAALRSMIVAALSTCAIIAPARAEFTPEGCNTDDGAMAFAMCEKSAEDHDAWLAKHDRALEQEECRAGRCEEPPQ
jgi:hypothetical protein